MKYFDLRVRFLLFLLLVSLNGSVAISQDIKSSSGLSQNFRKFDVAQITARSTDSLNGPRKVLRMSVNGEIIELNLTPNDLRSANYRAEDTGPSGVRRLDAVPVNTFKGAIAGRTGSDVRLTIDGSRIEGYFKMDGDRFFIEPADKYSAEAAESDSVIYKAEDSLVDNSFACEADVPARIRLGDKMVSSQAVSTPESLRRFDVGTEADYEFVNQFGSAAAANSEILSIMNMVEGTYSTELNLRLQVSFQHTWTTPDPYAGPNANTILTNFLNHWNTNYPAASYWRDAAHLFTAKPNVLATGLAYVGVVCQNGGYSYGLSGYVNWTPGKYLISAHEIAHNLGAQHVDVTQSCSNSLMNAQLTSSTPMSFCAYSKSQINSYIAASGTCLIPVTGSTRFDFDGDNRADTAVFRPSEGNWYIRKSGGGFSIMQFGLNGDKPVSADYDGDGKSDVAVFRNGVWWRLLSANNTIDSINFGLPGDIPVPANFDMDGKADIAVFRPSTGQWYWIKSGNMSFNAVNFGLNSDVPLPADFDGDGVAEVNVFRPSNGTWYRINSSNSAFTVVQFGLPGDKPLLGDFDGDARSDIAVWRPSTAEWFVIRSADSSFRFIAFGLPGDIPAAGDFDGDGQSDISVFRPSNGTWYRLNSGDWQFISIQYGLPGDTPVPSYYIQ
ncbi:MAG: FG-GAP-like repeat-containing protein [Pyrinomonadaceae bacterium]